MKEMVVQLGSRRSLIGILAEPRRDESKNGVGVLLINAGFTHRVGPQGMYVRLARRLADLGFTTLRFDYSGIGDSPARPDNMPFARSAIEEAVEAMDWLQGARGIDRFLATGLCWGADNSVRLATADARVVGIAPIDFYMVTTPRYLARVYLAKMRSVHNWLGLLRGSSQALLNISSMLFRRRGESSEEVLPVQPPEQVVAELRRLLERGVHIGFAVALGGASYDQHVRHFGPGLRGCAAGERLRFEVFRTDHTFTMLHDHAALLDFVTQWARDVAQAGSRAVAQAAP